MQNSLFLRLVCLFSVAFCQGPKQNANRSALTPELLLKLGTEHRNPLLQLVGTAFLDTRKAIGRRIRARELEIFQDTTFPDNATFLSHVCDLIECSPWSEWSNCTTGSYQFGMITRQRQCGYNNPLCNYVNVEKRTETQTEVCRKGAVEKRPKVAVCDTSGYELLTNKYCLKYVSSTTSRDSAQSDCQNDGAHVINVDSPDKDAALQKLLRDHGVGSSVIWLNGKRDDKYSDWEFTYGRQQLHSSNWSKWSSGEPSGGSSELCMVEEGSDRVWWDRECYNSYGYVCEIV